MIKPHYPPCFMVCLMIGIAVWLRVIDNGFWWAFIVGAFLYAFIAISKYPEDKQKEWESEGSAENAEKCTTGTEG